MPTNIHLILISIRFMNNMMELLNFLAALLPFSHDFLDVGTVNIGLEQWLYLYLTQ